MFALTGQKTGWEGRAAAGHMTRDAASAQLWFLLFRSDQHHPSRGECFECFVC